MRCFINSSLLRLHRNMRFCIIRLFFRYRMLVLHCSMMLSRQHTQRAMQHVHTACKTVLPRPIRMNRQCRCAERRQCKIDAEIGEHYVRRAFAVFFSIEDQPQRQTSLGFDDCRTVPAFDFDDRLLHAVVDTGAERFARREKEPQNGYRHSQCDDDGNQSLHISPVSILHSFRFGQSHCITALEPIAKSQRTALLRRYKTIQIIPKSPMPEISQHQRFEDH